MGDQNRSPSPGGARANAGEGATWRGIWRFTGQRSHQNDEEDAREHRTLNAARGGWIGWVHRTSVGRVGSLWQVAEARATFPACRTVWNPRPNPNRIVPEGTPQPLLHWVRQRHPSTPAGRAKQWILAGRVHVNGVACRKPHQPMPDPGETLVLGERHSTTLDCGTGWHIHPRVTLLHLDAALAVVNKGPGLIAVPAPNCTLSALSILADFLTGKLRARDRGVTGRALPPIYRRLKPLPVHRLDQHTSGVFCMATSAPARQHLIDQLKAHTMKREYVAFVEGHPPSPQGTWRHWLRLTHDELRQQVLSDAQAQALGPEAKEAVTHYEVIAEYPLVGGLRSVAKLRLRLQTGRKHQIRAQAAHVGLPLVGDRTYHPPRRGENLPRALDDFPRQALHAETLSLEHPDLPGRFMTWTAELPRDLRQLEAALRHGHA